MIYYSVKYVRRKLNIKSKIITQMILQIDILGYINNLSSNNTSFDYRI